MSLNTMPELINKNDLAVIPATEAERDYLDAKIVAYNAQCVPFTQKESHAYLDYVIKDNAGSIIGGITSVLYSWHCLYIDVLWVEEKYRNNDHGSLLLKH